jgi:hypothetical protein
MRLCTAFGLPLSLLLLSCATLPESGGEGEGESLPNAGAGPFRAITTAELGNFRSAPNALEDNEIFPRDPAVLDLDADPTTFAVAGYFGAAVKQGDSRPTPDDPTRAIVRYGALDARSFDRAVEVVLEPEEAWEGGVIGAPSVIAVRDEIFLYYAARGGIGLSRSRDGHAFTRVPGPVLGPSAGGWEGGAVPTSPGVVHLDDGSFRMFYEVPKGGSASSIGEASSPDGVTWTRKGDAPALAPRKAEPGQEAPYDSAAVGSPFPILATTTEGRRLLRLYYGARDGAGNAVVGLAARFEGKAGARFERAVGPVFGTNKPLGPREPCVLAYDGFTLLFATQRASTTQAHPAVAAGVAPATAVLPPPNPR